MELPKKTKDILDATPRIYIEQYLDERKGKEETAKFEEWRDAPT